MYHPAILPPCHICFYKARKLAGALICDATKTRFLTGVWQCRQTGVIMRGTPGAFFILLSKNVFCFSREITFHVPLFRSRWGKQEHQALWMKASSSWCTVHPGLLQKQHFWSPQKFFGRCCLHSAETTECFAFFMLGCLFSYSHWRNLLEQEIHLSFQKFRCYCLQHLPPFQRFVCSFNSATFLADEEVRFGSPGFTGRATGETSAPASDNIERLNIWGSYKQGLHL